MRKSFFVTLLWIVLIVQFLASAGLCQAATPGSGAESGLKPILQYIHSDWDVLTRSMTRCDSIVDPKLPENAVLYLPKD
ncbi:MAG: hypothetical protein JWO91_2269, partial [Acidobacteriaceae bacterium]|nr:hypothetical protein [Acidobacteriaceae bacterium]